ncbi:signal peptidase I [Nocardioides sp. CFH 31398]|uniref:signal peptidase I n=1 Tax=Nocardioides sp. CFH 31398 TaxID=2919579 RepID=UPI001F06BEC2|nr:signal peptidase I [Nocardioides sp. CFH 31398]MCH1868503.1 signal peptidase I [Nocardioides sp. CFH 31398]
MSIASLGQRADTAPRHRGHRADRTEHADQAGRAVRTPRAAAAGSRSSSSAAGLRGLRRLGTVVLWTAMAFGIATFAFLAIGPHVLGYRTATMLTGSMEPGISPGDVIVSVPRPASEVAVGDVISYHIPVEDHRVETHRVVEVSYAEDGAPVVVTKGDANPNKDPWTAHLAGDTVWQQVAVVPHLGEVVQVMRSPLVQKYVFWGALASLVLLMMSMIWRGEPGDGDDEGEDVDRDGVEGSTIGTAQVAGQVAGTGGNR